ncbi:MAG TPA: adenylate/guanylate cyclase domain-containing protein [Candidatus Limnocylindria bacterium]|nr:adenylate/guanylate cyclase domain-containing protein [Candidatus Limnocylindria bacterium]
MTTAEKWRALARILAITVPIGGVIGAVLGWLIGRSVSSAAAGAVIGVLVTAGIVGFNVAWEAGLISRRWREAPFLVVLLTRSLVWLAVIVVGVSVPLLTIGGLSTADLVDQGFVISITASFGAALLVNFVSQVDRLLGRGVLLHLVLGRYHRPREETRVFLLVDLRGSTQIAERLGNLRFHAYLRRFIGDVTAAVARHRGEVYRYVGDEVIVTWTAADGLRDARCVRAVFAVDDALAAASDEYEAEFGMAPGFWAGLHVGPVVAGEVGTFKHEITYLGDTLNVAARIEGACKELGKQVLASADVVSAIRLPGDVAAENLGGVELRGVAEPIEVFALTRAPKR